MASSPSNFIFTALPCEAKPLILNWKLKKILDKHPFAIHANSESIVVVTGIGKIAMAGAVGYALSLFSGEPLPILLNLGIAGHKLHDLGSLYLANKIINKETGKIFYPQFPLLPGFKTTCLETQDRPRQDYADDDCLYDMEAAAFYEIACKFSCGELIHSLKIISDNHLSPLDNISEDMVIGLVSQNLDEIGDLVALLGKSRSRLPLTDDSLFRQLTAQFHFTASNAVKLKGLLQNWQLQYPDDQLKLEEIDAKNGKSLIECLEKQLEAKDFYL